MLIGIECLPGADHVGPPAVRPRSMRIARKRVEHQNRVRLCGVQCPVSFVSDLDRRKCDAAIEIDLVECSAGGLREHEQYLPVYDSIAFVARVATVRTPFAPRGFPM